MYRLCVTMVVLLAAGVAVAQGPRNQGKGGMMGGMGQHMGQHMGMTAGMHDAMHESACTAFGLHQMKAELGLSTQQETQLRQFKEELLRKAEDLSTQITAKRKDLDAAVAAGKSAEVKQVLEQTANLRAQRQFALFEAAGKMKGVLTEAQRAKAATHEFHHNMMMHMTMQDMHRMMQFMGGEAMMMGPGMMGMGMMHD